jgi:hypothetical protein
MILQDKNQTTKTDVVVLDNYRGMKRKTTWKE